MKTQDITNRIRLFKKDLRLLDPKEVVTKHLTTGSCYIYDEETYALLKTEIAEFLRVHPNDVVIVGSGKMGFSIAEKSRTINSDTGKQSPLKRYQHFSIEDSDVDIAVCNFQKFDELWQFAQQHKGYWPSRNHFIKCLFDGWIRPDLLPQSDMVTEWFAFFEELSSRECFKKYDIKCGLYKTWYFLEKYQFKAVNACKNEIEIKKLIKEDL